MSERIYSTDGQGRWWVTEHRPQCTKEIFLSDRCQGADGHEGDHWCYRSDGTYAWSQTGKGGGWTPPGHKNWVSPADKADAYYMSCPVTAEVIDCDLIVKLEAGDVEDPITSPCTPEEVEELRRLGRLPENFDDDPGMP